MAYASPYYDPVKAHEYYMQHRKLKGRQAKTSTAGLNETGKIAAGVVKKSLQEEKKQKIKEHTEKTNEKIKTLQARLKAMTPKQRKAVRAEVQATIKALRAANAAMKKQLGVEYNSKYESELAGIKSDASMQTKKKEVDPEVERKSTRGLNEAGKEAAAKAKESIKKEQEKAVNEYSLNVSKEIERIQSQLSKMTPKQRSAMGGRFKTQLQNLRDQQSSKRKELTDSYNEKYYSELAKLKKNSKYTDT